MPMLVLPFPAINPIAVSIGPFVVRWYALAYLFVFLGCWAYASALVRNDRLWGETPHPTPQSLVDLVLYAMLGTVIGGRLGQVIFYEPSYYAAHPLEIIAIWEGGMSFHGGLIGVLLAIWYFAYRLKISFLTIADVVATICPLGIFLVRIGNFINSEHWGRPTDVPWAVVFPEADAQPRHPSQLYEAGLEGLLMRAFVKRIGDETLSRVPRDLDLKPYKDEHDDGLLRRMAASLEQGRMPLGFRAYRVHDRRKRG